MPAGSVVDSLSRTLPLWAVGLVIIAAGLLALEAGALVAHRQLASARNEKPELECQSEAQGYIISAIFGLLAFLLGLTFSIALDRYDSRRNWVSEEATAISTAYLRADLFDQHHAARLRSTLRDYARLRLVPDGISDRDLKQLQIKDAKLRRRLWIETRAAVMPIRETDQASYFVEAMNSALDVGTRRSLAGRTRIPSQILDMQFLYLVVAAGVLGYVLGIEKSGRRYASSLMILLFSLAFILILDIDRPRSGAIKVSELALAELVAEMEEDARRERPLTAGP